MLVLKINETDKPCPVTLDKMQKDAVDALRQSAKQMKERITEATIRLCNTQANVG
jgi:hypothetical protein